MWDGFLRLPRVMWSCGSRGALLALALCLTGSTTPSLRDHLEMVWGCPSHPAGPLGWMLGLGMQLLEGSHGKYWGSSSSQVSLRPGFDSTFQVGEKLKRGSTNWAKSSLKLSLLYCLYLWRQLPVHFRHLTSFIDFECSQLLRTNSPTSEIYSSLWRRCTFRTIKMGQVMRQGWFS